MNQKSKYFTPKRAKVREQDLIYKKKTQFPHSFRLGPPDLKYVAEIVYNNFITILIWTVCFWLMVTILYCMELCAIITEDNSDPKVSFINVQRKFRWIII
jgi:hypothetical protein